MYVEGKAVTELAENFTDGCTNLSLISLPKTDITLNAGSIKGSSIKELILPPYDYLRDTPKITIKSGAILDTSISYLYIPYSVHTIEAGAISDVTHIQCEVVEKPSTWANDWTDITLSKEDWGVVNG